MVISSREKSTPPPQGNVVHRLKGGDAKGVENDVGIGLERGEQHEEQRIEHKRCHQYKDELLNVIRNTVFFSFARGLNRGMHLGARHGCHSFSLGARMKRKSSMVSTTMRNNGHGKRAPVLVTLERSLHDPHTDNLGAGARTACGEQIEDVKGAQAARDG